MTHINVSFQGFDLRNNDRLTIDLSSLYEGGEITLAPYGEDNIWLARWTDEGEYFEADNPYDAMVLAMASRLPESKIEEALFSKHLQSIRENK